MPYRQLVLCAVLLFGLTALAGCEGGQTTGAGQTHPQSKTEEIKTTGGTEIRTSE